MKCDLCRKTLPTEKTPHGSEVPVGAYLRKEKAWLCLQCYQRWAESGRPPIESYRRKWTQVICFFLCLLSLVVYSRVKAEGMEGILLEQGKCFYSVGAMSYPVRCEAWGYKNHLYLCYFTLSGRVFRIEEVVLGQKIVLYQEKYVHEVAT